MSLKGLSDSCDAIPVDSGGCSAIETKRLEPRIE